jgi:oligopeptide transport system permease protein
MVGLVLVVTMILASIGAPWVAPHLPNEQHLEAQLSPPSWQHPCGTDDKGRDLLSRILYGGRVSWMVGLLATGVSIVIGVSWGATAAYAGGVIDNLMMRTVDLLYTIPFLFLAILFMVVARAFREAMNWQINELYLVFLAIGAVSWLTVARIVRGEVLSIRERDYVQAARALGFSHWRILFRHIVPNLMGVVVVYSSLTVPRVMLEESFLSFLGLGVQPPDASWGSLAAIGADVINPLHSYWWLILFPGLALALTLFGLNFLGDGLRDALDPRTSLLTGAAAETAVVEDGA